MNRGGAILTLLASLRWFWLGILGVFAIYLLFFHRLAERDLWSSHEARAGMDAQMILDEGVRSVPRLYDGSPELQKPPLYYWLVAALARLRGGTVEALDVRLPAAAAALLCVAAIFAGLSLRRNRTVGGWLAGVVLATALHFTWLARIGRIDMPLTLCITLTLGGLYLGRGREGVTGAFLLLMAYLALVAGVLLKGPIAVVLPATVMIAALLLEHGPPSPRRRHVWNATLRDLGLWWGLLLVALLTLPWFWWANWETHGDFARVFFWHHNFERGYGGSNLRSNPWWFYFPQFCGDFLPWSLLLPPALWWWIRRRGWRTDQEARFGLCWFVGIFFVLSCARFKRADYLLPAYPGAAVFLGCVAEKWLREQRERVRRLALAGISTIAGLMVLVWLVQVELRLPAREPYRDYRVFADQIRRWAPRPEEILFFRTEAHPLAFHLGRPLAIVVQWGELNTRLLQPGTHYVVTPPRYAQETTLSVPGLCLETILRNTDLSGGEHERPLVLLRASRDNAH
jgi:4-amino-4-deoxy-L-arabinose transferase-like glycosyltransferase